MEAQHILLKSKLKMLLDLVTLIFIYGLETWTLTAKLNRWIQSMKLICYHNILRVPYTGHVTKEAFRSVGLISQNIGRRGNILSAVIRLKLKCAGHVTKFTGLAKIKINLQGRVRGKRKRGRETRARQRTGKCGTRFSEEHKHFKVLTISGYIGKAQS